MTTRFLPVLLLAAAPLCHADLAGLFSYVSPDSTPVTVVPNGTIGFASVQVNQASSVTLVATNSGSSAWQIGSAVVSGPPFTASQAIGQVAPGASVAIVLSFSPTTGGTASGTFTLTVSAAGTSASASFVFVLKATGLAPSFITSYFLNPAGNQVPLANQGTISFNPTFAGQTSSATVIIANTGNGPGTLNAVTVSGNGFQLQGLPLLPAQVPTASNVTFTIVFAPSAGTPYTGSMSIVLNGATMAATLAGSGLAEQLVFQAQTSSGTVTVAANGTLTLAGTAVGSSLTVPIEITNTGNGAGQVGMIQIAGTGTTFALSSVPPLPAALPAGQSLTFNVVFTPASVGAASAQLFIDGVTINLAGTGVGPQLTLTMNPGTGAVTVAPNGSILFPNTSVGSTSSVVLQIANSGNAGTTVNSITISGAGFTLKGLPGLPASLNPGQSVSFTAVFTPTGLPAATGSLQVDNLTYAVRGAGTSPPPLPAISFQTVPANVLSQQQPAIALQIAQPYPLDISGTLTLVFTSSVYGDDAAIQFSTGGRTATFVIPANSTNAMFGQSGTSIAFQTGSVAGTIGITAALAIGTVDLTPSPAPSLTTQVAGAPPVISAVQVDAVTANSFELLISGYSNMRSVSQLTLTFTGAQGSNLQTSTLNINTDSAFSAWYQSATSWTYGSQFTASVTITASGSAGAVQAVSVTAGNSLGVSPSSSVSLQ